MDLEALTAALVNLSRLAVDYPEIRELDLNPVSPAPGLLVRGLPDGALSFRFSVFSFR